MSRLTPGLEKTEPYVWFVVGVTGIPSVFFWNWFGSKIGNDIGLFLANLILGLGVLFSVLINNEFGIFISCILFGLSFVPITSMCLLEGQKRFSGSFKFGFGSVFTISVKAGFDGAKKIVENCNLFSHLANVGDTKSLIIHPASTTHRQLNPKER